MSVDMFGEDYFLSNWLYFLVEFEVFLLIKLLNKLVETKILRLNFDS